MPSGKAIDNETFYFVKNMLQLGIKQKNIAEMLRKHNFSISEGTVSRINVANSYEDYKARATAKSNKEQIIDEQEVKKDDGFQRFIALQLDKLNQQISLTNEILIEIRDMLK